MNHIDIDLERLRELRQSGLSIADIMLEFCISRSKTLRCLKEIGLSRMPNSRTMNKGKDDVERWKLAMPWG